MLDPFCTIGAAIAAAGPGDTIHVSPGTYLENLVVPKDLVVIGTSGSVVTLVNGSALGKVVEVSAGVTVELHGLTLQNGATTEGGAGIDNQGTLLLSNSTVSGNIVTASGTGGGLRNSGGNVTIRDTRIVYNTAAYGGGLANEAGGSILVENSEITHNTASLAFGGGIQNGIAGDDGNTLTLVNSCVSQNNSAQGAGGVNNYGLASLSGAFYAYDSIIAGNTCLQDGGALLNFGTATFSNCSIDGNHADGAGGGVYNRGDLQLTDSLVTDNTVTAGPGTHFGGGISSNSGFGSVTLVQSTIAGNSAESGGGLHNLFGLDSIQLDHTIIAGNSASIFGPDCDGQLHSLGFNLIQDLSGCSLTGSPTGNQTAVDPRFEDAASGDYSLQLTSPAIDAGDPNREPCRADLAGFPRVLDGDFDRDAVIDLGALESSHVTLQLTGTFTPGGSVLTEVTGTAGLGVFLLYGSDSGQAQFPPFGCLFVDLSGPSAVFFFGSLPSISVPGMIPTSTPPGTSLALQALAIGGGSGNLSNAITAVIE